MQKAEVRLCFVFGGRNSSIRGAISEVKKMKVITALKSVLQCDPPAAADLTGPLLLLPRALQARRCCYSTRAHGCYALSQKEPYGCCCDREDSFCW
jgi:hypothetical protein